MPGENYLPPNHECLRHLHAQGSRPLPARDPQALKWSPGPYGIDSQSPLWPFHRPNAPRAYFGRTTQEIHPNTWTANCRA